MFIFYFVFFLLLNNPSINLTAVLKDTKSSLINDFFLVLDLFSITFILLFIVLYFLIFDLISFKLAFEKSVSNKNKSNSFFFIKTKVFIFSLKKFFTIYFTILIKKVINFFYKNKNIFVRFFYWCNTLYKEKIILWRPLFKRWSYYGLWSKKNKKD